MGLGVKEPKLSVGEHVPGTAILYDQHDRIEYGAASLPGQSLHGKDGKIILVPQPSPSPKDPLVFTRLAIGHFMALIDYRIGHNGRKTSLCAPF